MWVHLRQVPPDVQNTDLKSSARPSMPHTPDDAPPLLYQDGEATSSWS